MGRNTKPVTIEAAGRDLGKSFLITEMPALKAEKWALRAASAMGKGNINLGTDVSMAGVAAVLIVGGKMLAAMPYNDLEPLYDELMGCVEYMPELGKLKWPVFAEQIEEVATLARLRWEVLELHVGFTPGGAALMAWIKQAASMIFQNQLPSLTSLEKSPSSSLPRRNSRRSMS